jgi:hypothetical protein
MPIDLCSKRYKTALRLVDPFTKLAGALLTIAVAGGGFTPAFSAAISSPTFSPGNLVLTRSVYAGDATTVTIGQALPPNCPATAKCGSGKATDNGAFPSVGSANNVWNNDVPDGSFGVTSPIFVDQITTAGVTMNTLAVPTSMLVTSFSSKSELAVNLSQDGTVITFMGYVAPVNTLDVSNSNTPGVNDPTNPVGESFFRAVAQIDASGAIQVTDTNAYSGNNGRAAVLANNGVSNVYYTVGNDNNGGGTPANIVDSTGVEVFLPGQPAGTPVQVGNFSITQVNDPATGMPYAADKLGKDDNFRGLTVFNNALYVTKGSGSNGINTVYKVVDSVTGGLPTIANAANALITVVPGFPTTLAKAATVTNPFGVWFANATTLYVADEGDGAMADAATSPNAGLQKWSLVSGVWQRDYVLQNGLNLGQLYSVPNYPASLDPATDGLRNITGRVNADGTVTVWAVTSTVSANGDQGADPNKLVSITDVLANTNPLSAANERFVTLRTANYGEVLRGIAFTPGTVPPPAPPTIPVTASGLIFNRATRTYNGTITVLNNTANVINGPVRVVLTNLTPGVTLTGAPPIVNGSPAVIIPGTNTLSPGQSAGTTISFSDPSNVSIQFTPVVE